MFDRDSHLSDEELLLAADGEVSERRQKKVRRHLQACWTCRKRMADVERTIGEVLDCYQSLTEAEVPPRDGSEGRLRARLARESLEGGGQRLPWRWLSIAGAGVIVAAVILMIQQPRVIPNPALTPGEALPVSKSEVCEGKTNADNQNVPDDLREAVFTEYGLNHAPRTAYEVDFLITPALGGSASIRNLWPEPYNSRAWNAHTKDVLERRLHTMVCNGEIDLGTAQREIATNWVEAYKKYVTGHDF
jgi:hypothetical protein